MSAERLREAAALMRSRAEGSSNYEVEGWYAHLRGDESIIRTRIDGHTWAIGKADYSGDAVHIASWHPAVALAVADWLDFAAEGREALNLIAAHNGEPLDKYGSVLFCDMEKRALTVADAYLASAS